MSRYTLLGSLGIAFGVLLLSASALPAAPHSGGHSSGGHHGGGHHGGGHHGGGHHGGSSYHGGSHHGGSYHGGSYHGGSGYYHGGSYHGGSGYYHGGGYRGGSYYGGGYYNRGYYYPYYRSPGLYLGGYGYPSYYYGGYGNYRPSYYYATPTYALPSVDESLALTDSDVLFNVRVPAAATVWVNGGATTQTGPQREFMSSGLTPGRSYTYTLRARWLENGQQVERTLRVKVQGGERRMVDFLASAGE